MPVATPPRAYHLCSIKVCTGEQEYTIYELRSGDRPLTESAYRREVLEFCLATRGEQIRNEDLERIEKDFCEWAYDDRLYRDPCVQDVTKYEYEVLSRYLHCR